jgi:hypothetical protein
VSLGSSVIWSVFLSVNCLLLRHVPVTWLSVNCSKTFINRKHTVISVLKQVLGHKDIAGKGGTAPRLREIEIR